MSDDYSVIGLEPESAREYVTAVMTTLKTTTAKRIALEKESQSWLARVKLATEKGRPDLANGAQERADGLSEQITKLKSEEQEYRDGIARMMAQLKSIEGRPRLSGVDADLLLAQMDMLVGEHAQTDEKFRKAEADWALDDLKKQQDEGR